MNPLAVKAFNAIEQY